jgi:hypothetical protein
VNAEQSTLVRAAYTQLKATIAGAFCEDATAQVCSSRVSDKVNNTQGGDLSVVMWHEYEQTIAGTPVDSVELVAAPTVYVIQLNILQRQLLIIIVWTTSVSKSGLMRSELMQYGHYEMNTLNNNAYPNIKLSEGQRLRELLTFH